LNVERSLKVGTFDIILEMFPKFKAEILLYTREKVLLLFRQLKP